MAGSVRAVAAYAVFLIVLVREGVHIGVRFHRLVERGIESDDLGHLGKDFLYGVDTEEMCWVMERCELAAYLYLLDDILVHDCAPGEEIRTLDDAVANGLDVVERLENTVIAVHEGIQDEFHTDGVVGYGEVVDEFFAPCGCMCETAFGEADLLDLTLGQD